MALYIHSIALIVSLMLLVISMITIIDCSVSHSKRIDMDDNDENLSIEMNEVKIDDLHGKIKSTKNPDNNYNSNNEKINHSNNNYESDDDGEINDDGDQIISNQIKLLTKQLNALNERRRDDYKSLENNMKKYIRKNIGGILNEEIRKEMELLR